MFKGVSGRICLQIINPLQVSVATPMASIGTSATAISSVQGALQQAAVVVVILEDRR